MSKQSVFSLFLFWVSQVSGLENPIYLDHASSFSVNEEALKAFLEVVRLDGNSSGMNAHAKRLKKIETQSAKVIAAKIHADPEQIHFTSGATVANNIAILGVAHKNPGCHLITSKIEHKSVLNVFKHLEKSGYRVTYLDVDRYGNVDLEQLRRSVRPNTKLISIQMFNSEIGTLQNVSEIGKIAKERGIIFHSDAAQCFCKYDVDVEAVGVDLLTISGHKIGAPRGIAALYMRDPSQLQPILFGSGDKFFPGTKSTELIAAFAKAVEKFKFNREQISSNFNALISELSKIDKVFINSATPSPIVSISLEGVLLTDVMERMMDYSFASGCSCTGQERSNVLEAIDPQDKLPSCTIRISFSDQIMETQLINFAKKLKSVVEQLRLEKKVGKGCESTSDEAQKNLNSSLNKIKELMKKIEKPSDQRSHLSTDSVDKYVRK